MSARSWSILRRVGGAVVVCALLDLAAFSLLQASGSAEDPRPPAETVTPGTAGLTLTVTPHADGVLVVTETLTVATPVDRLTLRGPVVDTGSTAFAGARPRLSSVLITAQGRTLSGPDLSIGASRTVELGVDATQIELSYRVIGATVRSIPSTQGRALGAVGPAVAEVDPELPVAVAVRGPAVLTLSCPRLPEDRQDCAAGAAPDFRVDRALPWRSALVDVQLDLGKA